jgi:hypothetical protein
VRRSRLASDVLFTPEDPAAPYALIFDVKSWTRFPSPTPCKPFCSRTLTP